MFKYKGWGRGVGYPYLKSEMFKVCFGPWEHNVLEGLHYLGYIIERLEIEL